jgi:tetratricopeptide (TPR) repeat protein
LGSALVALLSLGAWIALQIFFQDPPEGNFTLPAIPVDTVPPGELITEGAIASPPPSPAPAAPPEAGGENDKIAAIRRELSESPDPDPALFLRTASALSGAGKETEATGVLRDGFARHRESEDLRLALADQLFTSGTPYEAWELIARTGRPGDSRFASRLLKFSLDAGRADETLVILATAGDELPDWSDAEWLIIVRLHEATGQLDRAIEIADRRGGDRTELFRLRAVRAEEAGKLDEAIFNREQYLAHLADPPAADWSRLAALYTSAGREEEAARAQRQADTTVAPAGPPAAE